MVGPQRFVEYRDRTYRSGSKSSINLLPPIEGSRPFPSDSTASTARHQGGLRERESCPGTDPGKKLPLAIRRGFPAISDPAREWTHIPSRQTPALQQVAESGFLVLAGVTPDSYDEGGEAHTLNPVTGIIPLLPPTIPVKISHFYGQISRTKTRSDAH